jgi:cytochrome bd ubiquinol oxidase subunit II
MTLELFIAGTMIISLTFYVLMAGADYGGGVWDLFASGPRAAAQRALIAEVIGPIWEANHVWLILVVVILFTGFPPAFAVICTGLHIPLTLMLIGIILRGSAFSFRTYDNPDDAVQRRWSRVFAIASSITPIMLGACVGAISSGRLLAPVKVQDYHPGELGAVVGLAASGADKELVPFDFFGPWLSPFSLAIGVFALSLFAFLAATYLTHETADTGLQKDFRRRALISQVFVAIMALSVFLLAQQEAPALWQHLSASQWALPLHAVTAMVSCGAIVCLWTYRFKLARMFAAGQSTLILWGWAFAQFPYLVRPDLDIFNSAAPQATLSFLSMALLAGALLLFPSFYYLLRVFHQARSSAPVSTSSEH